MQETRNLYNVNHEYGTTNNFRYKSFLSLIDRYVLNILLMHTASFCLLFDSAYMQVTVCRDFNYSIVIIHGSYSFLSLAFTNFTNAQNSNVLSD